MRFLGHVFLAFVLLFGWSATSVAADSSCPPGLARMIRIELYFGLAIPGGGTVTPQQWSQFSAEVLATTFPSGFTVLDASGQWLHKETKKLARETTKVVIAALPETGAMEAAKVAANAYTTRFKQQSVGITVGPSCAAF